MYGQGESRSADKTLQEPVSLCSGTQPRDSHTQTRLGCAEPWVWEFCFVVGFIKKNFRTSVEGFRKRCCWPTASREQGTLARQVERLPLPPRGFRQGRGKGLGTPDRKSPGSSPRLPKYLEVGWLYSVPAGQLSPQKELELWPP